MATAQDLIDQARLPLVDVAKKRFSDADGLKYLNFALKWLRRHRADLFIGSLKGDFTSLSLGSAVPVPENVHQALADYMTARVETHDDEAAMGERAKEFFSLAAGEL
jgi:hypothetical protein